MVLQMWKDVKLLAYTFTYNIYMCNANNFSVATV